MTTQEQFKDRTKVKFIYKDRLLKGQLVGSIWIVTDYIEKFRKGHVQIALDREYCKGFVGLYNAIDLLKDIILDDDGYLMVELFNGGV